MDKQQKLHRTAMVLTVLGLILTGIAELAALLLFRMVGGFLSFFAFGLGAALFLLLGLGLLWGGTGCFIAEYLTWKKNSGLFPSAE